MRKFERTLTTIAFVLSIAVVLYGYIHHYIETGKILFIG